MGKARDRSAHIAAGSCRGGRAGARRRHMRRPTGFQASSMTDSQYVTDWSGFYIGGKLGGAWSDINWHTDANVFNTGGRGGSEHARRVSRPAALPAASSAAPTCSSGSGSSAPSCRSRARAFRSPPPARSFPRPIPSRRSSTGWHRRGAHRLFLGPLMVFGKGGWARRQRHAQGDSSPAQAAPPRRQSSSTAGPSAAASSTRSGRASSSASSTTTSTSA